MVQIGITKSYTVQEVAALLKVTPTTVRAYIKNDILVAQKSGRRYLITEETLQAFLAGNYKDRRREG